MFKPSQETGLQIIIIFYIPICHIISHLHTHNNILYKLQYWFGLWHVKGIHHLCQLQSYYELGIERQLIMVNR